MSAPPPTLFQKAKAPFMGVTLLATAGIAAWQSNRMYKRRQETLLTEFGATMVFHIADVKEMKATLASFRKQLGPGSYTGRMFETFLKAMATDVPIGVQSVKNLKQAVAVFGVTDAAAAKLLEAAADDLGRQPSVLGKLTFLAERAMPMAASMAKLRTKFPNWSFDTVTALQRAMLENIYRELIETLPRGSNADAETLEVLGLSDADAARLTQEVWDKKDAEAAAEAEAKAEEERAKQLQEALMRAAEAGAAPTRSTATEAPEEPEDTPTPSVDAADDEDEPLEVAGSGTHEYECTKCGYVLFPAAGREHKFFGAGFTCPQCNAPKSDFVDNGPVD